MEERHVSGSFFFLILFLVPFPRRGYALCEVRRIGTDPAWPRLAEYPS